MNETEQSEHKLILRGLRRADYPDIKKIMNRVYKGMGGAWKQNEYETLIQKFAERQICIEDNVPGGEGNYPQAIVEALKKVSFFDFRFEVFIGRRNQPNINPDRFFGTNREELQSLKNP